jgi:hypothetical protein
VIDTMEDFEAKQETLQLMKDMLQVNGDGGQRALRLDRSTPSTTRSSASIGFVDATRTDRARSKLVEVLKSQIKTKNIKREERLHAAPPWRARGVHRRHRQPAPPLPRLAHQELGGHPLARDPLPKIVVSLGVNRTDAGWLGNGLYFGDASCTSAFYTTPGKRDALHGARQRGARQA